MVTLANYILENNKEILEKSSVFSLPPLPHTGFFPFLKKYSFKH